MHSIGILIALCALPQEARLTDDAIHREAVRLGLAHVATGSDEVRKQSAVRLYGAVQEPLLRARRERILKEIEQLGEHDWAGTYSSGDGRVSITITIAPEAGATYTWRGCGLYDLNHGDITEVSSDRIELDLAIDPAENKWLSPTGLQRPSMSDEWIIVRWGEQRYMVPTARMISFCNEVSRYGRLAFWHRRNAVSARFEAPPVGLPEVPPEYRPFLLSAPLIGSILSSVGPTSIGPFAGGKQKLMVRAEIDLGTEDGLLPGMEVDADLGLLGDVVAVQHGTATVEFRFAAGRNGPSQGWSVRVGPLEIELPR